MIPFASDVKSDCPSTTVAAPPVDRLAEGYFRIRLLPESATHKLPDESKSNPFGALSENELRPPLFATMVPRLYCPNTIVYAPYIPKLSTGYLTTRLLPFSATHKLPDESNVDGLSPDDEIM